MTEVKKRTVEQWVDFISHQELPAMTSTAKLLDKFANDDVSSLPKLSQSILHDQALSSCVLKVANSIKHMGRSKVTTVSRATVVLGIHSVKNICLTSKLLEGLFSSQALSPKVYERLTQLMANSFYAGLLAKMMVPDYNEDTQEEVYLAAMLYRIGESAFWSVGGDLSEQLINDTHLPDKEFNDHCTELIGTNFSSLSKGLARNWHLGDLLVKALDHPESRTAEMRIIALADKLSSYISSPPDSIEEFNHVLDDICTIKKINVRQLKALINQTRIMAIDLLKSYNAGSLEGAIKTLPTPSDFDKSSALQNDAALSPEKIQLNALMQLSQLTKSSKDVNEFLQLTLKAISSSISFERNTFFMLTTDKQYVQARFSYNQQAILEPFSCKIAIANSENLIAHVIGKQSGELINNYQDERWNKYLTQSITDFINEGTLCVAPVSIGTRPIGIIASQKRNKNSKISQEEYEQFMFIVEHLNMCLSIISMK